MLILMFILSQEIASTVNTLMAKSLGPQYKTNRQKYLESFFSNAIHILETKSGNIDEAIAQFEGVLNQASNDVVKVSVITPLR